MIIKLLFNIFIVYAIWQILRMVFAVKKVQTNFHKNMSDINEKMNEQSTQKTSPSPKKPLDTEGEYVDYEEIK